MLTIPQPDLLAALSRAAGFQAAKLQKHTFGHVLVDADSLGFVLQATDGSMDVHCRLPANGQDFEPFECLVPADPFRKLIERLPAATPVALALDAKTGKLRVKSGRSNASLPTMPTDTFPELEEMPGIFTAIPGKVLAAAVTLTAFAAGDSEDNNFNQLRLRPGDAATGGLTLEALDGHAYARTILSGDPNWRAACGGECGLGAKRIQSCVKWLETATHMAGTAKRLFFADPLGWWSLPALRGEYPDTSRFVARVNAPGASVLDIDTAELAAATDRLSIVQPEKAKHMRLSLSADAGGCLESIAWDGCRGQGLEPLPSARAGEGAAGLKVVLPGQEFGTFCARAPRGTVRLVVTPNSGPVGVMPLHENGTVDPSWLGILVPMNDVTPAEFPGWKEAA